MSEKLHSIAGILLEGLPHETEALKKIALRIKVTCSKGCDLRGKYVEIRNEEGSVISRTKIISSNGESGQLIIDAPSTPGEHYLEVVFPSQESAGIIHEEKRVKFKFKVKPHKTSISVWDIITPIIIGEKFKIKVGVKCITASCNLSGRIIGVYDDYGIKVGEGILRQDVWKGTESLYWTEIGLNAPKTAGKYTWFVKFPVEEADKSLHMESSASFSFLCVNPPECVATIKIIDERTKRGIEGVLIRLGPYKGVTDEKGVVSMHVSKGTYRLSAVKEGYDAFESIMHISKNVEIEIPLKERPIPFYEL